MFKEIFRQEVRYTIGFPLSYLSLLVFIAFFTFIYSRGEVIVNTLVSGEWVNSPHAITAYFIFFTLIGLIVALPIFNNAAHREIRNQFSELLFTTPISRFDFFFGRFAGAFALLLIPALLVIGVNILGVKIGLLRGAIPIKEVGPFRIATFVKTFLYLVLPNILIAGSFIFSLVILSRKSAYAIIGVALLMICHLFASFGLQSDFESFGLAALLDPFGDVAFNIDTRYQTAAERNATDLLLSGHLLLNRIVWVSGAMLLLLFSYHHFSFLQHKQRRKKASAVRSLPKLLERYPVFPKVHKLDNLQVKWLQFRSFFRTHFIQSISNPVFILFLLFLCSVIVFDFISRQPDYGVPNLPLTYMLIEHIRDYDLMMVILLLFLSGEGVWNDRQSNIDEIIDASPHATYLSVVAKAMAVWSAILLAYSFFFLTGIGIQLFKGYYRIDLLHYLIELVVQVAPGMFFFIGFSIFIHSLVNHKFLAYAIVVLIFAGQTFLFRYADWESHLLSFGRNGSYIFSDLNDYGPFMVTNLWFDLYWMLLGLLFVLLSLWIGVRGKDLQLRKRMAANRRLWSPALIRLGGLLLFFWILTTGFIFYNTKILNHYSTSSQTQDLREQYERQYKQYEHRPMPQINHAQFFVDFYPEQRQLRSRALLNMKNHTDTPIDSLFISVRNDNNRNNWINAIDVPNAQLLLNDQQLGFRIYALNTPLLPGDSLLIETQADYTPVGFENTVGNTSILDNGSFIHHARLLPHFGYRKPFEIRNPDIRKERSLPPRQAIPQLHTGQCHHHCSHNQLTDQHSWMTTETIISTSDDQTALSSGELIRQWKEEDRNYFHYRMDQPSLLFVPFISARYVLSQREWNDIQLEVYHDPKHDYNVAVMLDEMENAMEYYTTHFGPYYHRHVRIVEFPQYASYAQAFPGIMPYSESRGFILDFDPEYDNNPIASTVGHEIGHQWWGHQIVGADMQGSQMLTESFAEYSSLMIMKKSMGVERMTDFLQYDYDRYLWRRSWDRNIEQPLYKASDQPYIYYRKGSVVLYTLSEMIGEAAVNRSLRNFLETYRYQPPPYPRTIDYLQYLEAEVPDSLQYLIQDLFYDITFFKNAIENASYQKQPDGKYQLQVDFRLAKNKVKGEEEFSVPINDWFEVGVYTHENDRFPKYVERIKLTTAQQSWYYLVDFEPAKVVLDPRLLFFDRQREDNELRCTPTVQNDVN